MEDLQRIGVKVFSTDAAALPPRTVVPVFHRWIQAHALDGHVLIDVADYEHVPGGPGVVLVAHEGLFGLARDGDRFALTYTRRAPVRRAFGDRLRVAVRSALRACQLLEAEAELDGRLRFRGEEIELFANDRLHAPNTPEQRALFDAAVREFLRALYGDERCTVTATEDPRERLGIHVLASTDAAIATLLQRVA
jgi:hypothetical protein